MWYGLELWEVWGDEKTKQSLRRVPGGWIYCSKGNTDMIFIPFSDEFMEKSNAE